MTIPPTNWNRLRKPIEIELPITVAEATEEVSVETTEEAATA